MFPLSRRRLFATAIPTVGIATSASVIPTLALGATDLCTEAPGQSFESPPEYLAGAPERSSFLEPGIEGERLDLTGRLITTRCEPIGRARIEFWHTDPQGKYDMAGFKRRGFQATDAEGRFRLETMMPGYYSPMRHVHFLVSARMPGRKQPVLLSSVVELPRPQEYGVVPETPGRSRRPHEITQSNGVFHASYDIVVEAL